MFHEDVPESYVHRVWTTMQQTSHHTYQILTKRPDRMARITAQLPVLSNVWLGTSVENSDYVHRVEELKKVSAVVRFISFEPLIGRIGNVDLSNIHWVIVGGESGPKARPMCQAWVDEIEAACRQFGAAFFFKQWGGKNKKAAGRLLNGQTYDEMPQVQNSY